MDPESPFLNNSKYLKASSSSRDRNAFLNCDITLQSLST